MKISFQLINRLQKLKKLTLAIEIHSISGAILSDQNQLFHPLCNQVFCFCDQGFKRQRSLFSSNLRNNAKRTGIITAFSDLEVFKSKVNIGVSPRICRSLKLIFLKVSMLTLTHTF